MRLNLLPSLLLKPVSVVRMSALAAPLISIYDAAPKTYPKISENESVVTVTGFHDMGIICSDINQSKVFYEKIGFTFLAEKSTDKVAVLCNKGGMEAHLSLCDKPIDDNMNILMDYPVNKYPGHTHASFQVPNVAATQTYLESQGMASSSFSSSFNRRQLSHTLFLHTESHTQTTYDPFLVSSHLISRYCYIW